VAWLVDPEAMTIALSGDLTVREVRLEAKAGKKDLFDSSSLSEGRRRPSVVFFMGETPRTVSGIAEGNKVGLLVIRDCEGLLDVLFDSCADRSETSRLLLLCIGSGLRDNSELLPAPRITTGARRLK
jgi:hypothetical protein